MKVAIIYESITGNTKLLADTIEKRFTKDEIVYCGDARKFDLNIDADLYFIGSWTNRGDMTLNVKNVLRRITNKNIALFGTCGYGGSIDYFKTLESRFKSSMDETNKYLGCFICQGKMPLSVKNRYIDMIKDNPLDKNLEVSLKNYEEAVTHPDMNDLENLKKFVSDVKNNI